MVVAGGEDAAGLRDVFEHLFIEAIGEGAAIAVAGSGQSDFGSEHVIGTESGIDGDQLLKAADDEGAEKNDDDGDGDFGGDENGVAAMMVAAAAIAGAKDIDQRCGCAGGGEKSKEECRERADGESEEQHRDIEADGLEKRFVEALSMRESHAKKRKGNRGQQHAERSAEQREHERLDEELAEEMPAVGAEGLANCYVAAALSGAHEEKIGDIDARDDEHENNSSHEAQHGGPERADEFVVQRSEGDAFIAVGGGIGGGEALRDGLHVGACGGEGDARTQAAEHSDGVPDARCLRGLIEQREWQPHFAVRRERRVLKAARR